ncbi:F-box only protein 43 [Amia ocellicauda]|uniref:F-box only protein 43 n=1 Tax=Amia ocellicauda TaxID=2972642 RepID=UPI003463E091
MDQGFSSKILFPGLKHRHSGSSQDSGYNESLDTSKLEMAEAKDGVHKPTSEHNSPQVLIENLRQKFSSLSSITSEKDRLKDSDRCSEKEHKKENIISSSFCETPRVSKKDASLRRRLLLCKAATGGSIGYTRTSEKDLISSGMPSFEEDYSSEGYDSPDNKCFEALATSTLKAEELASSCRKRRLMFSQMRTSTLEDEKKTSIQPPECSIKELLGTQGDLDESIISCFSDEHLASETLETPRHCKLSESMKENFQTPVSSFATKVCENVSVLSTPSLTPIIKLDTSTTEDSGFNSIGLDKSNDSFVDHDGSFQEMVQPVRRKETSKVLDVKRKSRLERLRRLSTLREGGSQSEEEANVVGSSTEDIKLNFKCQTFISEDDELFLNETQNDEGILNLEDFSRTPALQAVHAMCQRSARKLPEQISLEDLLGISEGSEPFRTTMPLDGLIGRKMGLKKLDILAELNRRNLRHVLAIILHLLSSEDIYRFGQVSDVWDTIIFQNKIIQRRRQLYLKDLKIAEQGSVAHVLDAETRLNLQSRSALKSVQAQAKTPITPGSNSWPFTQAGRKSVRSSKQDDFLKVAKTLFNDESLRPCPRCQSPAKCHPVKKQGVCSREDCAFDFCMECLCAFHGSKECGSRSGKRRPKKEVLPGSAQSKRNLKRL